MADLDFTVKLGSLARTAHLGRFLGEIAEPGDVIILKGPLGAGKTTLAQFIGAGLEVPGECYITSPTFSLMHEYPGRLPMYHMDLFRLSTEEEIEDLGFVEYIYGQGLTVIEWPDRLGSLLPEEFLELDLELLDAERRSARVIVSGDQWRERAVRISRRLA